MTEWMRTWSLLQGVFYIASGLFVFASVLIVLQYMISWL